MDANAIDDERFRVQTEEVPSIVRTRLEGFVDFERASAIDFGCDLGIKTYGYAQHLKFAKIVGVDITANFDNLPAVLERHVGTPAIPPNVEFCEISPGESLERLAPVDCFISWSVFEHIRPDILEDVTRDLFAALRPGGIGYVQVNPLYFSRYGSHLRHHFDRPWQHLLDGDQGFETRISRSDALTEGQKRASLALFRSLNQLRLRDFDRCFSNAGFEELHRAVARSQVEPLAPLLEQYAAEDLLAEGFYVVLQKPDR